MSFVWEELNGKGVRTLQDARRTNYGGTVGTDPVERKIV